MTYKQWGLVERAWGLLGPGVCFCCPLTAEERGGMRRDGRKSVQQKVEVPSASHVPSSLSSIQRRLFLRGTLSIQQTLCSMILQIKERCEKIN